VYSYASFLEWAIHRHIMHIKTGWRYWFNGKDHIAHHSDTRHDMTLKTPKPVRIPYSDTFILVPIFAPGVAVINQITGMAFSFTFIVVFCVFMSLLHSFMWNSIHSRSHFVEDMEYSDGVPLSKNFPPLLCVYNYFLDNHIGHHHDSTTNFNVCFPGADYLLGTRRQIVFKS
jgi:hypothetical protein